MSSGYARANRYRVIMPRAGDSEALNVLCDSITWPGRQMLTTDYYTGMRGSQISYAFGAGEMTIGFYLTNNWEAWDYLNEWHKRIITRLDDVRGYRLNFKNEYQEDIIIDHLDTEDNVMKTAVIFNAFPNTLKTIELGNANSDLVRVTAGFVFDNWSADEPTGSVDIGLPQQSNLNLNFF